MPAPRIALLNWRDPRHSLAGGSERYAWEFARALAGEGFRVDFVTARDSGQASRETIDDIAVRRAGGQFTFYVHAFWYLLGHRRRLDLVVDPSCGIPCFSPLFVRRRTPVILLMHHVHQEQFETYFPLPLAWFGQWLERWLMPRVYRRARTLAVSDSTSEDMVRRLGWRYRPEVLANGTELGVPNIEAPQSGRLAVFGRLVRHKRVEDVLRAVALLVSRGHDLMVDVVGKGPEQDELARTVASLGLGDRVRLHGFLSEADKVAIVREAQLHVCASDSEGWGQVVIEAAALGVPTVARDVPGLRDSVLDGRTGWLLRPAAGADLSETLAHGIAAALDEVSDPVRQLEMRAACRDWAARFSWGHMRAVAAQVVIEELGREASSDR